MEAGTGHDIAAGGMSYSRLDLGLGHWKTEDLVVLHERQAGTVGSHIGIFGHKQEKDFSL